ncbi:hypothetical protein D3C72_1141340 [compost metagenome]
MLRRKPQLQTRIHHQAVTIQRRTGNGVFTATGDQPLAGFCGDLPVGMFPAGTEPWRQLHTVIQRIDLRQSQAKSAVEIVLFLALDL